MKKFIIGVLSLACVSCLAAAVSFQVSNVSAEEQQQTGIFTETKCQISKTGDKMLMVTGITDVSKIYEVGYDIGGGYQLTATDVAETNKYYESLTLGGVTKTAGEFIEGAEGLLIWEVQYDVAYAYTVQPYAYLGELNESGQLVLPEVEEKTYGTKKENFNVFTVTFKNEEGGVITTVDVKYGAAVSEIEAPAKDWYDFDGWYVGEEKYDFAKEITGDVELTAKYVESKKMVYSVANGNIKGIATGLSGVELTTSTGHNFGGEVGSLYPLNFTYSGEAVSGANKLGISFDFGKEIKVSDYEEITIVYQAVGGPDSNHTYLYFDGAKANTTQYGGPQTVELTALANKSGVASFQTLEVSFKGDSAATAATLYVAYIEFVLAEKAEVPTGPQSITYSMANGNFMNIATGLSGVTLGSVGKDFGDGKGGVVALNYVYSGEAVSGANIGIEFNLGNIDVEKYASIKIAYQAMSGPNGNNTLISLDGTQVHSEYGGIHIIDLKADAIAKGVKSFSKLSLTFNGNYTSATGTIVVGYIELVAAEVSEEPEVPTGPQNVTYSMANGNLMGIATPLNGVTLAAANRDFGAGSVSALYYSYSGADVKGDHKLGIIFDINVNVSDYESITIVYQSTDNHYTTDGYTGNGNGTAFWINGTAYPDNYGGYAGGGVQTIDLIKLATDKGMTTISTFELQLNCKNATPGGNLWVSHIEFKVAQS